MTQSTFTNFKYQVDKISLRNRRGVTVTFDYNGEPVKRILVFKEKEGVSYVENAKRVMEREYRNGQLEKYAKKYVRHNNKSGKSPVMPILVGTLAVAALALTGVVTYKAFTSSSGGGGGGDPTVNYYMVDFDTNGGSYTKSQKIESGKLVTKPADPTKVIEGFEYKFDGWYDAKDGGNQWDFGANKITADKTIYAHWTGTPPTPSTYHTVSFDTQGGSFVEAQQIQEGGKVTKPADPTKTEGTFSYTFAEWWTAPTGGTKWDFDKNTISGDTIIYAHWTGTPPTPTESFTVDFDTNGGSYIKSQKIEKGGHVTKPDPDPTRTEGTFSYTFDGWWDDKDGGNPWDFGVNTITGDTTIYAHWTGTPPTPSTYYTVSFNSQGGSFVPSQQIEEGGKATEPTDPTRKEGTFSYTFAGWWDAQEGGNEWKFDERTINKNETIYAHWTGTPPTYYTVNFDTQGGSSVESQQIESGKLVTEPADPTRIEGDFEYEFKGWYKTPTGEDQPWNFDTDTVTSKTTIYAHWSDAPTYYTVTFDTQGGSHIDSETVVAGECVTEPITEPTKLGWEFDGWWNQQEGGTPWDFDDTPITGNTTIFAHWKDTERTITFVYQNGTDTTKEVNVRVGEHLVAPDTPVYAGHTFNGWFDASTEGTRFDFTKVFTKEMLPDSKLYAQWTADPIVINVDPNGGTFEDGGTEVKQLLGFDTDATWGKVKTESEIDVIMPDGATSYSYQYYDVLTHGWVEIPNDNFKIKSDLSVRVAYTYLEATVNFVDDYGAATMPTSHNVTYGTKWIDIKNDCQPTGVMSGFKFDHYYIDNGTSQTIVDDTYVFNLASGDDITLHACYEVTITFNNDASKGTLDSEARILTGTKWGDVKSQYTPSVVHPEIDQFSKFTHADGSDVKDTDTIIKSEEFTAVYTFVEASSFTDDSWEIFTNYLQGKSFQQISETGPYKAAYDDNDGTFVGLTRTLEINGTSYTVRVIGENDNNNKLTFEFVDVLNLEMPYSLDAENNNYSDSYINNYLNNTFIYSLPTALQGAIKTKDVPYYNTEERAVDPTGLRTKLFILSAKELGFTTFPDPEGIGPISVADEGTVYSFYSHGGDKVKKFGETAVNYWTRTPEITGSFETAWNVNTTGELGDDGYSIATNSGKVYIAPAFTL